MGFSRLKPINFTGFSLVCFSQHNNGNVTTSVNRFNTGFKVMKVKFIGISLLFHMFMPILVLVIAA